MTIECKNHTAAASRDRCYMGGCDADHQAAAGGITTIETCQCGAERRRHHNGSHSSPWDAWSDSDVCWWVRRNRSAIAAACSEEELANIWVGEIMAAAERREQLRDLEQIRRQVRQGRQITLYARA